jgi:hypothetical protein
MEELRLEPSGYRIIGLNEDWHYHVFIEFKGKGWAVCQSRDSTLSKSEKCFCLENQPSSRTKEDFEDTRFATSEEAFEFFKDCLKNPNRYLKEQLGIKK